MELTKENIGKIIRARRKSKNMTLKDLANKLGCSLHLVCKWEKGHNEPKATTLIKLEEILDMGVLSVSFEEKIEE